MIFIQIYIGNPSWTHTEIKLLIFINKQYKMGSIQRVISSEHDIDLTGTYHKDSFLLLKRINVKKLL